MSPLAPLPPPATVVVLPDTQFYAAHYPAIFEAQVRWILENHRARRIGLVVHTGDIVDAHDDPAEWQVAGRSLHQLDGIVPYLLAAGNHDYDRGRDGTLLNASFPVERFARHPWWGGTYAPGDIGNSYALVPLEGQPWLVLSLEFGPRDAVLQWADGLLARHRHLPAMLVTHAYLFEDGTRYDHQERPWQRFNPHHYAFTPEAGTNDGEQVWQKLVSRHQTLRLVLSGHVIPRGVARQSSVRPDGSVVHELLANYQRCAFGPCERVDGQVVRGGNGYLRILELDHQRRELRVATYSPYLDAYLDDDDNQFVLPLP